MMLLEKKFELVFNNSKKYIILPENSDNSCRKEAGTCS